MLTQINLLITLVIFFNKSLAYLGFLLPINISFKSLDYIEKFESIIYNEYIVHHDSFLFRGFIKNIKSFRFHWVYYMF